MTNKKGRPRKNEVKRREPLRIYPSDKEMLIERFGSLQKGIDQMIEKLKGEKCGKK